MIEGFIINYKSKDDRARVLLNHTLYGRIIYRNYRGKHYAYYVPGLLHEIKYKRLRNGVVFVSNEMNLDKLKEYLEIFGTFEIIPAQYEETELTYAKDFWADIAKQKKMPMRIKNATI